MARRRRVARKIRLQVRSLMLRLQVLKKMLSPLLAMLLLRSQSLLISLSTSHSLLVMLERFNLPPTISLPLRKTQFPAATPLCSSQLPLRKVLSTMFMKT